MPAPMCINPHRRHHCNVIHHTKCLTRSILYYTIIVRTASFFFGARIWLGTILGRFSIIYFSGLGLRIRVRVWVRVRVCVRVRVWVRVRVGVRVSVVIWSL